MENKYTLNSINSKKIGLKTFAQHIWKKYLVYLSIKVTDKEELYLEKILKYSDNKGLGKIVISKLIVYAKTRGFKIIRIRVYPLNKDIGTATKEELLKLIIYYQEIGFIPIDKLDNVTGNEAFEMIYNLGGD